MLPLYSIRPGVSVELAKHGAFRCLHQLTKIVPNKFRSEGGANVPLPADIASFLDYSLVRRLSVDAEKFSFLHKMTSG